jgi:rubrerythrin
VTDFDIKRDQSGNVRHYLAFRQAAPKQVVTEIEVLYQKLLEIEKEHGMQASVEYLMGYLEERNMNYDQFIENLAKPKGLTAIFFSKMKKIFS